VNLRAGIFLLIWICLAGCAPKRAVNAPTLVTMRAAIDINRPAEALFAFAADPENDLFWRKEVVLTEASGPLAYGALYREEITLGLVNNFEMQAQVTHFQPPFQVRVQAPAHFGRTFTAERIFTPIWPDQTRVHYSVTADIEVVNDITRSIVTPEFAERYYAWVMQSYLRQLKWLMEARPAPNAP